VNERQVEVERRIPHHAFFPKEELYSEDHQIYLKKENKQTLMTKIWWLTSVHSGCSAVKSSLHMNQVAHQAGAYPVSVTGSD